MSFSFDVYNCKKIKVNIKYVNNHVVKYIVIR